MLVEERTFSERNYAGEEAEELYERLRARGSVVDTGGVFGAIKRAIDGAERQREA